MADGGPEPPAAGGSKDNPFSFKSFITRRATVDGSSGGRGVIEEGSKKLKKKKKNSVLPAVTAAAAVEKEEVPFPDLEPADSNTGVSVDNPFSFKTFVKRKKTKTVEAANIFDDDDSDSSSSSADEEETAILAPLPLPVISEIKPKKTALSAKKSSGSDAKAPVKLKPTALPVVVVKPGPISSVSPPTSDSECSSFDSSLSLSLSSGVGVASGPVLPAGGGGGGGRGGGGGGGGSVSELKHSDDGLPDLSGFGLEPDMAEMRKELKKWQAENERLDSELKKSHEKSQQEKEKNAALKEQLKVLKKKEAEDTKALENMVQKVEQNLVRTTERAVSAEAIIGKLKQEIQSLQVQLSKSSPQTVHQQYEEILRGVREKSNFASQQLSAAAHKADLSIRDLVAGVDALKNVAEVLEFIDRISTANDVK